MDRPRNLKQMQSFFEAFKYYRDMWPKRAQILSSLSDKSGKKTFYQTEEMDNAFKQMKAILSSDALMAYQNHNKPFPIYTYASDYHIGAVIMQNKKPVAYWVQNRMVCKQTIQLWRRKFFPS